MLAQNAGAKCWRNAGAMLAQCWRNAGAMLAQCWRNAGAMLARNADAIGRAMLMQLGAYAERAESKSAHPHMLCDPRSSCIGTHRHKIRKPALGTHAAWR
jgi:hypothetical protein